jgi:hypothetical protein
MKISSVNRTYGNTHLFTEHRVSEREILSFSTYLRSRKKIGIENLNFVTQCSYRRERLDGFIDEKLLNNALINSGKARERERVREIFSDNKLRA